LFVFEHPIQEEVMFEPSPPLIVNWVIMKDGLGILEPGYWLVVVLLLHHPNPRVLTPLAIYQSTCQGEDEEG
jgi:hypothetical protein